MDNPKLNILLLGPPLVTLDGKPVRIKRRLPRALLYYLAGRHQPPSRDELCNLFWPNQPESLARKNLREAISHLRRDLGVENAILSLDSQLYLNPDIVYSDLAEFQQLVRPFLLMKESPTNSVEPLAGWMVAQLSRAMSLCRAPQIIKGVHLPGSPGFENWLEVTNRTYVFGVVKIIASLSDYYISIGDLDGALVWLRQGLDIEPLNFDFNYLTLTCLRDTGKIQQLIDYVNYQENLYKEHEEEIPAQFLEIRKRAEESGKTVGNSVVSAWPIQNQYSPEFVGRQAELGMLNRMLRRKGVLHLSGAAGKGKTRLMQEFFNQQAYAPRLLYYRAHRMALNVPFMALIETLEGQVKPGDWALISEKDQEILSGFYHNQLQNAETPNLPETPSGWLPVYQDVFNAFLRLMEGMAQARPMLFILDDAWWCDMASLTLLAFLIERNYFKNHGLLVLITDLEIPNNHLNDLLLKLKRSGKLESIRLVNYSPEETSKFVQMMTGQVASPALLEKIQLMTGGNPLFMVECMRLLRNTGMTLDAFGEEGRCPVPESIEALLQEKLKTMTPLALNVLRSAAVLGNWFTPDVLELIVKADSEAFLAALEDLVRVNLIESDLERTPAGGYHFKHDIERQIVLNRLDPARRRDLHLKAVEAILQRRGKNPDIALRVAQHYEAAGEPVAAIEFWVYAGEEAQKKSNRDAAYRHYARALELTGQNLFQNQPEKILELVNLWADYAYDLDDNETCRAIYQSCTDFGYQIKSPLLIGAGKSGLGRYTASVADFETAKTFFDQAIFHLKKTGDLAELYETYCRLGILNIKLDEYSVAAQAFEEGLKYIGSLENDRALDARINLLTQLGILLCYQGQPVRALQLATELADLSLKVRRDSAGLQAAAIQSMALFFNQRFTEVIRLREEHRYITGLTPVREWLTILDLTSGNSYLKLGDLDNAWKHINLAVEREKGYPYQKLIDSALELKGDIHRVLGEYEQAYALYQEVITSGAKDPAAVECRFYKGLCLVHLEKFEEGLASIDESIALAEEQGFKSIELKARVNRLLLTRAQYAPEELEERVSQFIGEMKSRGLMYADYFTLSISAGVALDQNDQAKALALYEQMAGYFIVNKDVWQEIHTLKSILALSAPKSAANTAAHKKLKGLLEEIGSHANNRIIRPMFTRFRKRVIRPRNVNVLSTAIRYK